MTLSPLPMTRYAFLKRWAPTSSAISRFIPVRGMKVLRARLSRLGEYDDQCHYLPRCIEKIIDVGIRTIDISTIVEIMLRLGLPDEKMHQVTAKYVKDLIALTREINHLNHNNESMRREMETVVQTVDEGIITLDAHDNVLVFNAAADSTIIMERGLRSRFPRSD